MTQLLRTTSGNPDFQHLVKFLDEDLAIKDGSEHAFYAQFNKIDAIRHVIVYYDKDTAVGCGAFKNYDDKTVEIKRMFVQPDFRGRGIAAAILKELESWVTELNYTESILETGKKQADAIRLYQKAGYIVIPNYGQYKNAGNSVCMKKIIR